VHGHTYNDVGGSVGLASAKPRYKKKKFASDKHLKIVFRNPPEIEKTL